MEQTSRDRDFGNSREASYRCGQGPTAPKMADSMEEVLRSLIDTLNLCGEKVKGTNPVLQTNS